MSDGSPPAVGGPRTVMGDESSSNLYGGVTIAGLGFVALCASIFYYHGTGGFFGPVIWPRLFSSIVILAGLAMASGIIKVRSKQDFIGGLALIALSVVGMLVSIDLPGMRGFAFGPGTAPRLFANVLATLGLIVAVTGIFMDGPEGQRYSIRGIAIVFGTLIGWVVLATIFTKFTPHYAQAMATVVTIAAAFIWLPALGRSGVRGPFMITLSIFSFAMFIRPLGLVIASFMTIMICAGASEDVKWRETVLWGVILTTFCSFLFPWGLNLPFQLWPRFW
jgi:putative tricarboxylic transport membrane protein